MKAKTKEITAMDYAKYLGKPVQTIRKRLKTSGLKRLPDVIEVIYYSRFYLFVVPDSLVIPE
jgi:hypothetical protein